METVIRLGRKIQSGEPDWEQRRYEIAKDAMAALIPSIRERVSERRLGGNQPLKALIQEVIDGVVTDSVEIANLLVDKLKKTQDRK